MKDVVDAMALCIDGSCGFCCTPSFADGGKNASNGSEVNLTNTDANCRACGCAC